MATLTTAFTGEEEDVPLLKSDGDGTDVRVRSWERPRRGRRRTPPPDYEPSFLSDDSLPSARNRNSERRMQIRMAVQSATPSPRSDSEYGTTSLVRGL